MRPRLRAARAPSRFRKMPLWTRYGAITILLIAIIFAVYAAIPVEQAHLQIICQHSFRSAQLSVLVDGSVVYSSNVNVASKKRLGILPKGQSGPEIFSKLIDVPTGRHVVQVRISAPDEGFDQARSAAADFTSDRESILQVNATRRNALAVNFDGATASAVATTGSSTPDSHPLPKVGSRSSSAFWGQCFPPASASWCRSSGGRIRIGSAVVKSFNHKGHEGTTKLT